MLWKVLSDAALATAAYNGQGDRRRQQIIIPIRLRVSQGPPDRRLDQTPGRAMDCSKPRSPERSCR